MPFPKEELEAMGYKAVRTASSGLVRGAPETSTASIYMFSIDPSLPPPRPLADKIDQMTSPSSSPSLSRKDRKKGKKGKGRDFPSSSSSSYSSSAAALSFSDTATPFTSTSHEKGRAKGNRVVTPDTGSIVAKGLMRTVSVQDHPADPKDKKGKKGKKGKGMEAFPKERAFDHDRPKGKPHKSPKSKSQKPPSHSDDRGPTKSFGPPKTSPHSKGKGKGFKGPEPKGNGKGSGKGSGKGKSFDKKGKSSFQAKNKTLQRKRKK